MERISVDFSASRGPVKPLHAVNNSPVRITNNHTRGNLPAYAAAGFPYARNHDASFSCEHIVDVHAIFPNFDADETDPASYDFILTDDNVSAAYEAGAEVFYRLGAKIEHARKKYNVHPPKDFAKWARICEHIIRHYTEGWADGFRYKMTYWEIWNEPDIEPCWTGTPEQFMDLYVLTLRHLMGCFPHLKIGGPALSHNREFAAALLDRLKAENLYPNFFSWHFYGKRAETLVEYARFFRGLLDEKGFTKTESLCTEWNLVYAWSGENFVKGIEDIISMKGAAFDAACMLACDAEPVDMLMYYDARATVWNGLFDYYTMRPLPGYHSLAFFNHLFRLGQSVSLSVEGANVYAAAAKDENGKSAVMLAVYAHEADFTEKEIELTLTGGADAYEVTLLDKDHTAEIIGTWHPGEPLCLNNLSVVLLKSL